MKVTQLMTDEPTSPKTWLAKLSEAMLREPQDREQLMILLYDAKDRGLITGDALAMIEGVLQVTNRHVRDAMIPAKQMVSISVDATYEQALPIIIESQHSRFPVIGENRDDVLGILLAKDLLQYAFEEDTTKVRIRDLVRPALFIPESKRLEVLLREFRQNRNHIAMVVDEYGGVAGLITIEDVLEEIVGEIEDEYDEPEEITGIRQIDENNFIVQALTPVEEFNEFFDTDFSDAEVDTIGGILLQRFSHLPKRGESIRIENFKATVLQASNRHLEVIRFTKLPPRTRE